MATFGINIRYFGQTRVIFFDEQFPSWDIFLCHVAQVFIPNLDEDIVGNQIYLWMDEDNKLVSMIDEEDLIFALVCFQDMEKVPTFHIWFDKLPYNLVTSSN